MDALAVGDWFKSTPSQSLVSTVDAVQPHTSLQLLTMKLPRSSQRFHISLFFQKSASRKSRVHEGKRVYLVLVFRKEIACSS